MPGWAGCVVRAESRNRNRATHCRRRRRNEEVWWKQALRRRRVPAHCQAPQAAPTAIRRMRASNRRRRLRLIMTPNSSKRLESTHAGTRTHYHRWAGVGPDGRHHLVTVVWRCQTAHCVAGVPEPPELAEARSLRAGSRPPRPHAPDTGVRTPRSPRAVEPRTLLRPTVLRVYRSRATTTSTNVDSRVRHGLMMCHV